MNTIVVIVIAVVIIGVLGYAYSQVDPEGFAKLFPEPPPKVIFLETPNPREHDIKEETSTIISVVVRNMEIETTVENVFAKLSVVRGNNWEEHLEFNELTKLSDKITPKDVSESKNISIKAIKLSGEHTPFGMRIEILVDGVSTKQHDFDIKIIP